MAISRKKFLEYSGSLIARGFEFNLASSLLGWGGLKLVLGAQEAYGAQGSQGILGASGRSRVPRVNDEIFVLVFLRGGYDALNLVPPIEGEDRQLYEQARPNLKLPLTGEKGLLKLDDRFGLHPSARPLHELYLSGKLAFVHSAGLTSNTRSHFDAQNYIELGIPDKKFNPTGWLARHLFLTSDGRGEAFSMDQLKAVAVGNLVPTALKGYEDVTVINQVEGFNLLGNERINELETKALLEMYSGRTWLDDRGKRTLMAMQLLNQTEDRQFGEKRPQPNLANGSEYPKGEIGNHLRTLSQLIKMNLGIRIATVDMGGWDTHKFQGNGPEGFFSNHVRELSEAVATFYHEFSNRNLTVVIMSEFGRRLKENANHGTDHGHGGVMMVLGNHVYGGKVYGHWQGLRTEKLYDRADLAVTTDFRQVLGEILIKHLRDRNLSDVFPGYKGFRPLGIVRALA